MEFFIEVKSGEKIDKLDVVRDEEGNIESILIKAPFIKKRGKAQPIEDRSKRVSFLAGTTKICPACGEAKNL